MCNIYKLEKKIQDKHRGIANMQKNHFLIRGSVIGLIAIIAIMNFSFKTVFAAEDNKLSFSVHTEQSEYQVDKTKSYFDLKVPFNKSIPLIIQVTDNSEKEIKIEGDVNAATTNINGVVEYDKTHNKLTNNVPFDIKKSAYFKNQKQIIKPKKTVDFILNITMPKRKYKGIVAGGITFRNITEGKKKQTNKLVYAIALLLHGDREVKKNRLIVNNVVSTKINGREALISMISNETAKYINKFSIDAKVIKGSRALSGNLYR